MRRDLAPGTSAAWNRRTLVSGLSALFLATASVGAVAVLDVTDATASRTIQVRENASLKLVKKSGSTFTHRGRVTGTIPGTASSRMTLNALSLTGSVTIRAKGGSVTLRLNGRARSAGLRSRFSGSATISGGTGRYAKARGTGKFDGVVNRSTWASTINASGSLTY